MPLHCRTTENDRRQLRLFKGTFLALVTTIAITLAAVVSVKATGAARGAQNEPRNVTFKTMATYPVEPADGPVPEVFQELDGAVVTLTGYMLPLTFNQGRTRDFMLMRSQAACCFGQTPKANEFVFVTAAPVDGVAAVQDVPLAFTGVLRVRPVKQGEAVVQCFFLEDARAH